MKALILVGGYGTRLRPLTITVPKPVVEILNKPMLQHQIEALAKCGVDEVILAVSYKPDALVAALEPIGKKLGVKITFSKEDPDNPLGTAGPIGLAKHILTQTNEPFFVFNSDVVCPFPLEKMLEYHRSRVKAGGKAAEGTILVTKVDDPSKYGVILYDQQNGCIDRFVEKPKVFVGDRINAGMYILEQSIFDLIEPRRMSIEREVFPKLAERGTLYAMGLDGFWADVGQPKDFIRGTGLYLDWIASGEAGPERKAEAMGAAEEMAAKGGFTVIQPCLIDPAASIASGAVVGPYAVIGAGCKVAGCARVKNSTLLPGAAVEQGALVNGAIIGWNSKVGKWARIQPGTVVAEKVNVKDEVFVNGALVLPFKDIAADVMSPTIIM